MLKSPSIRTLLWGVVIMGLSQMMSADVYAQPKPADSVSQVNKQITAQDQDQDQLQAEAEITADAKLKLNVDTDSSPEHSKARADTIAYMSASLKGTLKKFQCSVTLKRLIVTTNRQDGSRWDDDEHSAPDLSVHLYGAQKRSLHVWPTVPDQHQIELNTTTTWSPCLRYQPMMIVVYDQDPDHVLEMIAELPLRIDLLRRMPQPGETKSASVRLSGGSVQMLDVTVGIERLHSLNDVGPARKNP